MLIRGGSSVIDLHVFPTEWAINPSPFCVKAETYCRLAGIPYRLVPAVPFRAPRGKLPYIVDDGQRIPDSGLIIEHLKQRFGDPLDAGLDAARRARAHLIRRTCEESLYFVLVHFRWIDDEGWQVVKPAFFGGLPPGIRDATAAFFRRRTAQMLRAQGTGRQTPAQILAMGAADLAALAETIGGQEYAAGAQPSSCDATLYGFLANILASPARTAMTEVAARHQALVDYVERMRVAVAAVRSGFAQDQNE